MTRFCCCLPWKAVKWCIEKHYLKEGLVTVTVDIVLLMFLGFAGYLVFALFRIPAPALLGAFAIVGLSNLLGVMVLPVPHPYFFIAMQILLGMFVGTRNKDYPQSLQGFDENI